MLRIGLTGGIGSGKTTVARIFETLGIPVYYADDAAKRLMNSNPEIKQKITALFGNESYNELGLNKQFISSQLFNNPENVQAMNAIVHPVTIQDARDWMATQTSPYAVKEAALIFESGSEKELDYVIGVSSPLQLRMQRIKQRDGIDEEAILKRMQHQMNEEEKISKCDFVIYNDEKESMITQVLALHNQLKKLSTTKQAQLS